MIASRVSGRRPLGVVMSTDKPSIGYMALRASIDVEAKGLMTKSY